MEVTAQQERPLQGSYERFLQYLEDQGDWLEKARGNLLVSATVIASMSFAVIVNPPGGVWQSDDCSVVNGKRAKTCGKVGTSILADDNYYKVEFLWMISSCLISFSSSMAIILLVVMGFRFRNRVIMTIMVMFMVVAVVSIPVAVFFCVMMLYPHEINVLTLKYYFGFWGVFLVCVFLIQLVRFLWWVIRVKCCSSR